MRTRFGSLDLSTSVGDVHLPNPIMTASGTAGHGDELGDYVDLSSLGAVVSKSLAPYAWNGNTGPRVYPTRAGMINSVGLQGPGVERWLADDLPRLLARGATVVASIWGRTVDEYGRAAAMLRGAPIVAVEVNLSCPNLDGGKHLFAHDVTATNEVMLASAACGVARWAKLSPSTHALVSVAAAALDGGAAALTLGNTVPAMVIDVETRRPALHGRGGGLSGAAIHPIAVRAVYEVRAAFATAPIVGVGGVATGADAVEMLMAGANAVQVGTASFADPRASGTVLDQLQRWLSAHGVARVADLISVAHEGAL